MRSPLSSNKRKARSQYGNLVKEPISPKPQPKTGFLANLGRVLKDEAALIAALVALAGVIITQFVTTSNTQANLTAQQELEEQSTLEEEWQTYLDDMGEMILDEPNPLPEAKERSSIAGLARAKTLAMLERLDTLPEESKAHHKGLVLRFLRESNLIDADKRVISLQGANLRGAHLVGADLVGVLLTEADLEGADLEGADLRGANLGGADLSNANLEGATLHNATGITTAQLEEQAGSLTNAVMPNGSSWRPEESERIREQSFKNLSRAHSDDPVAYEQTPPVGGDHNVIWQNQGFYEEPVPNEKAVHTLEHGAVWITYDPDLPQDQKERLRQMVEGEYCLLASPYQDLPAPIVASAWGKQLQLQSIDEPKLADRLAEFILAYRKGPQTPEDSGRCSNAPNETQLPKDSTH